MDENLLISIIIPVYNAELFLEECITSVLAQTYKKLEVILVNDGSNDSSAEIIRKYATDTRIISIEQSNQGSVLARKKGVSLARGEYITFVDADDWIEPLYIQKMCEMIGKSKPDVVSAGTIWEFQDYKLHVFDSFEPGEYLRECIKSKIIPQMLYSYKTGRQGINGSLWNKFFESDLLKKEFENSNVMFSLGDDAAVVYPLIFRLQRLVITDICSYHYRQHDMSMVHTVSGIQFDELKCLSDYLSDTYTKYGCQELFQDQIKHFLSGYIKAMIWRMFNVELMDYSFVPPIYSVPKKSRVLIYGAGKAGRDMYRAFQNEKNTNVIGWFDKDFRSLERILPVLDPAKIPAVDFDYILIAIRSKKIADEVRIYLKESGVNDEKILWWPLKLCVEI